MKLATTTADFETYGASQKDSVRYIHEAGFRYIDYNFCSDYSRRDGIYSNAPEKHIADVKSAADELGVKFIQAHSPMGIPITKDDAAAVFAADTIKSIEACAALGIENIVVHTGYDRNISKEETFERNKRFYMKLLPYAEKFGVNILAENFNKMVFDDVYWIDNAADLRALIDYIGHPMLHACWDAGHGNMTDTPQHESIAILGEHVYALHIQDNFGDDDSHMAPFCGSLNLDSLMHGLLDIGYKGYFTFEACRMFLPDNARRVYLADTRLAKAPLGLRIKAENLLYETGKYILSAYNAFEE